MHIQFIPNSNIEDFEVALNSAKKEAKSIFILSYDENNYDLEKMNSILSSSAIPIIGGIFPQIIYKNNNYKIGTLILALDEALDVVVIG